MKKRSYAELLQDVELKNGHIGTLQDRICAQTRELANEKAEAMMVKNERDYLKVDIQGWRENAVRWEERARTLAAVNGSKMPWNQVPAGENPSFVGTENACTPRFLR